MFEKILFDETLYDGSGSEPVNIEAVLQGDSQLEIDVISQLLLERFAIVGSGTISAAVKNNRRLELHELLVGLLGSRNVYFQPPSTIKMQYPCIVYQRSRVDTKFADDIPYNLRVGYQVIIIDANPDSPIPERVAKLPLCGFDRRYTAENLNHDVYDLFY